MRSERALRFRARRTAALLSSSYLGVDVVVRPKHGQTGPFRVAGDLGMSGEGVGERMVRGGVGAREGERGARAAAAGGLRFRRRPSTLLSPFAAPPPLSMRSLTLFRTRLWRPCTRSRRVVRPASTTREEGPVEGGEGEEREAWQRERVVRRLGRARARGETAQRGGRRPRLETRLSPRPSQPRGLGCRMGGEGRRCRWPVAGARQSGCARAAAPPNWLGRARRHKKRGAKKQNAPAREAARAGMASRVPPRQTELPSRAACMVCGGSARAGWRAWEGRPQGPDRKRVCVKGERGRGGGAGGRGGTVTCSFIRSTSPGARLPRSRRTFTHTHRTHPHSLPPSTHSPCIPVPQCMRRRILGAMAGCVTRRPSTTAGSAGLGLAGGTGASFFVGFWGGVECAGDRRRTRTSLAPAMLDAAIGMGRRGPSGVREGARHNGRAARSSRRFAITPPGAGALSRTDSRSVRRVRGLHFDSSVLAAWASIG